MAYDVDMLAGGNHGTRYRGVTRDLVRRVVGYRTKAIEDFTKRDSVDKRVWSEMSDDALTAIARDTTGKNGGAIGNPPDRRL